MTFFSSGESDGYFSRLSRSPSSTNRGAGRFFPDAVTVRGARHLRELAEALTAGFESAVLFVVQRGDAKSVTAARAIDPNFAAALEAAQAAGVLLLAYRSRVSLSEAVITEPIPVRTA